jgi:hypothetical protein
MRVGHEVRRITAPDTPFNRSSSVDVAAERFCDEDIELENARTGESDLVTGVTDFAL